MHVSPPGSLAPSSPPGAHASGVTRLGSAAFAGALAALVASIPAATRIAGWREGGASIDGIAAWFALSAASLIPLIFAVIVLRGARRGLAAFAGPGAPSRALAFLLWCAASALVLLVLGAALRATTHHHALAGATYALVGLAVTAALGAFTVRLLAATARLAPPTRALVLGLPAAAFALALFAVALRVARSAGPSPAVDLVIDIVVYAIAALLAARDLFVRRPFAAVGPPLAALVVLLGVAPIRTKPIGAAVGARAPLLVVPVDLVGKIAGD